MEMPGAVHFFNCLYLLNEIIIFATMKFPGLNFLLNKYSIPGLFFMILLAASLPACKKGPQEQKTVYSNDFESGELTWISGIGP